MYNPTSLETFISKVNDEAEKAAQKVFNSYQKEFEKRVLNQLQKGDVLYVGMGTASLDSEKGEKFCGVVGSIQYLEQRASFSLEYKTVKI